MKAFLLSAGYGKRLLPLTKNKPKCLIKIKKKPMLGFWISKLSKLKVSKYIINTHYLHEQVNSYVKKYYKKYNIFISYEKNLLGTAGTLINYFKKNKIETTLLIHVDNYCLENINNLIKAHKNRPKDCLMTMMIFKTKKPNLCGIVKLDKKNVVKEFYEKQTGKNGNLANCAVYILSPECIRIILKKYKKFNDFSIEIIPKFINKIFTYQTDRLFKDMGTLKILKKLNS